MQRLQHVIVSGAGPSGLMSAFMLKNAGIRVTVLERVPKTELLSDVGGAYDLYPNTMRIFQHLSISNNIMQKSEIFKTIRLYNKNGNIVRNISTSKMMPDGDLPHSALRSVIQSTLLDEISNDVDIECDSKVIDYIENDTDKTVKVICANQKEYECDLLIVADGVWSKIGQKLLLRNNNVIPQNYCNVQAYWGRYPGQLDLNIAHLWMDTGKSFAGGVVRSVEGEPVTIWSGFENINPLEKFSSNLDRKQHVSMLMKSFGNQVEEIVNGTDENDILDVGIYDRDKINSWSNNRNNVILTGDAAHPMTPMLGQGANSAITDAFILCKLIEKYEFDVNKLGDIVKEYESVRMDGIYKKIVQPARTICKYMLSDSSLIQFILLNWMKYSPEKYMAYDIIKSSVANDVSSYLSNGVAPSSNVDEKASKAKI